MQQFGSAQAQHQCVKMADGLWSGNVSVNEIGFFRLWTRKSGAFLRSKHRPSNRVINNNSRQDEGSASQGGWNVQREGVEKGLVESLMIPKSILSEVRLFGNRAAANTNQVGEPYPKL